MHFISKKEKDSRDSREQYYGHTPYLGFVAREISAELVYPFIPQF